MQRHLVVVGSLNMDLVVRAPRHPAPGETLLGGPFQTFPGGKGANQAVAAARLGAAVKMVGQVGSDDFGAALVAGLAAHGVDAAAVRRGPQASGVALITVADSGQNTIVVASGANAAVTPEEVEAAPVWDGAAALLLQLETPLPAVQRAAELARARGIPVLLNPAPAQPLPAGLLARVDVLIPNEPELALLTGQPEVEAGMAALRAAGAGTVIVTLGGRGVRWVDAAGVAGHLPAHPVTVVDTTAAGDAFVGGLAVALAEGRPLAEAVAWGNAAGALAVTRAGAQPSLPARAEVEALLR